jgi:hypothetical protein
VPAAPRRRTSGSRGQIHGDGGHLEIHTPTGSRLLRALLSEPGGQLMAASTTTTLAELLADAQARHA